MSDSIRSQEGFTRREFVLATGTGIAGLAVGAGVVGGIMSGGDEEGTSGTTASTEPIVVGGAYTLTGWGAADGVECQNALEMVTKDINDAGGVLGRKLTTAVADIESDLAPDKIRNQLERLINEKHASMISMLWCSSTNGEWDPVVRSGLPVMHCNALSANTKWVDENYKARGNIWQTDPDEFVYANNLLVVVQGLQDAGKWKPAKKTVAIITSTDPYSVNIANTFREGIQKAGWKTAVYETITAPLAEWGPVLAKVHETVPDLIVNTDWLSADLAAFTKQFAASPTPSLVYEQYGPSAPDYLELVGDAGEGVVWTTTTGVLPDEIGTNFRKRYDETYPQPMGWSTAGMIYDEIMMWAQAASMAGNPSDYAAVRAQIKKLNYRGVTGVYRFLPDHNCPYAYPSDVNDPSIGQPSLTFQIQNRKQVLIDPIPYLNGEFKTPPQLA